MGLLSWIIFGGLAGWVATLIIGGKRGCLGNVILGVIGAFIGGFVVKLMQGGDSMMFGWDWYSFGVAVVGASLLLLVTGRGR